MADRRLGHRQLTRRSRETLEPCRSLECAQSTEGRERNGAFWAVHADLVIHEKISCTHGKDSLAEPASLELIGHMKLYRFRHSPFARKVQTVLDLLRVPYEVVDVAYGERNELAELTGGYVFVPVLVDDGKVLIESRDICAHLLGRKGSEWLAPAPLEGPIWAYADFADNVLEDITFRIASPDTRKQWPSASDRALYTMNKERKFGAGCIEQWLRDRDLLLARASHLLAPSFRTLEQQPFLFGDRPTLADAALHGQSLMLQGADPSRLARLSPGLVKHAERMVAFIASL
jgi:glutathione S-transferase